ncbi:MAG: RluA family pseudouridine synthase [Dehalococcoidia bacterium]
MIRKNMKKKYEKFEKIRLDKFLNLTSKFSRAEISKFITNGNVSINNKIETKPSKMMKFNDVVEMKEIITNTKKTKINSNFKLNIRYEDDDLMVISKDSGISVHAGVKTNSETLTDLLLLSRPEILNVGESIRPGIVHRLDKGTSGLMIIAKKNEILEDLKRQFKSRKVFKEYLAIVNGITKDNGIINAPIGRHPTDRLKRTLIRSGKEAHTSYKKIESSEDLSFLRVIIQTGRTHQIRVHLSSIGHPVYGDKMYSNDYKHSKERILLHSYRLRFLHPNKKINIDIKDSIPKEFSRHFSINSKKI